MLCYLFMAADFVGRPDERRALLTLGFVEILLAANLVVRHNVAKKLKRVLAGCCVTCGYDLRATADRCPECGTCPPK
jgi:lipopolysaccharide biosynthesis regulator YciM